MEKWDPHSPTQWVDRQHWRLEHVSLEKKYIEPPDNPVAWVIRGTSTSTGRTAAWRASCWSWSGAQTTLRRLPVGLLSCGTRLALIDWQEFFYRSFRFIFFTYAKDSQWINNRKTNNYNVHVLTVFSLKENCVDIFERIPRALLTFLRIVISYLHYFFPGISLDAFYNKHIIPEAKSHIIETIRGKFLLFIYKYCRGVLVHLGKYPLPSPRVNTSRFCWRE